jgi:hemolysin
LAWADLSYTTLTADEATKKLLSQAKVMFNSGTMYGQQAGAHYLRINLACTRETLIEALKRVESVLLPYMAD